MNKYISSLLLLASTCPVGAVDSFDPRTNVLTIPSVVVNGGLNYKNVRVRLDNYFVLAAEQGGQPSAAVYEDTRMRIDIKESGRGKPVDVYPNPGRSASFKLVLTNKTGYPLYLADASNNGNSATLRSLLVDENGGNCGNTVNIVPVPNAALYASVSAHGTASLFFDSGNCRFTGNVLAFTGYLWTWDDSSPATLANIDFSAYIP